MDKKILVAVLLIAVVALSGCVKIALKEDVLPDGKSDIQMTMDMTNFPSTGEEETNPCEGMAESTNANLANVGCSYENKILKITGQLDRASAGGLTINGTDYRLDVKQAAGAMGSDPSSGQELPEDKEQLAQLKAMGVTYDYYVKLPGTMTKQEGGTVQSDGYVKFDLLDLPDGAYVESSTAGFALDMTMIIIIAGVVVLLIATAAIIMMVKR